MEDWKKRRGIAPETRVFSITGNFPGVRKALVARGWVENEDKSSMLWNFKYALWQRDIGEMADLDDLQVVNYFARNAALTSKAGLCDTLYSCCTLDRVDINSFYPRCFDLTSQVQVANFVEDFKATTCASLLRRFVADGGRCKESGFEQGFPRKAVAAALEACARRALDVDDSLDAPPLPLVTDEEWAAVQGWSLKKPGKALKAWGKKSGQRAAAALAPSAVPQLSQIPEDRPPLQEPEPAEDDPADGTGAADGAGSEASDDEAAEADAAEGNGTAEAAPPERCAADEALFTAAKPVLQKLAALLPQWGLDGMQNIWVLKPAGKSRGRGIQLSARLEKILDVGVGRGAEARWIAQKYIENPMIIDRKKFDIRQWVIVTRWNPLAAWFYGDCYLRFSFHDYDPSRLKNRYAHLTNNSISKHAEDYEEDNKDDTMWHSDDFQEHLKTLKIERDGKVLEDPWLEVVQPAMKRVVYQSLECAQDCVLPRSSSFELFGYDFMVAEDLSVWLIEVNSSPDLSYSTSTTRGLVKAMLEDMASVIWDTEKFGARVDRPVKKWGSCKVNSGRYELLEPARRRREEKFRKIRKDAASLAVVGTGQKLRKPKKGECPRGLDAEDDPRYDAIALLASAPADDVPDIDGELEVVQEGDVEDEDTEDGDGDEEEGV